MRITVCSEFFCDPYLWLELESLLQEHYHSRPANARFRAWSMGCSNGMESYSLALLLADIGFDDAIQILATEVNSTLLNEAKSGGPYSKRDVANIDPAGIDDYFTLENNLYRANLKLRNRIEYLSHDLRSRQWPDYKPFLALYRNIEPFFDAETNYSICNRIHTILEPGGILFTSSVDRIPDWRKIGFEKLSTGIYRKLN